jgi:HEAT repeat protein
MSISASPHQPRRGAQRARARRGLGYGAAGFAAAVLFLLASLAPALALLLASDIDNCPSLDECLRIIGTSEQAGGSSVDDDLLKGLAKRLHRFGDPAKRELLKRAAGDDGGWQYLAREILMYWGEWEPTDIPALRAALRRSPNSSIARPLGEIGTQEAIQVLVEDLSDHRGQTDFALSQLGDKALPYLIPLLEDDRRAPAAALVIGEMKEAAAPSTPAWVALALDPKQPQAKRLAALRAVAALKDRARPGSSSLVTLLRDADARIKDQARETLKSVRDPVFIEQIAASCHPEADPFDPVALAAHQCLHEIAMFGEDGRVAGPYLMPFLTSKNALERVDAIAALGSIGDEDAIPQIEDMLNSGDWRIVYASLRSLGWLGARQASARIEETGRRHWMPEIRQAAAKVLEAFRSSSGRLDPLVPRLSPPSGVMFGVSFTLGPPRGALESFDVGATALDPPPNCSGDHWRWDRTNFTVPFPDRRKPLTSGEPLRIWAGRMSGINRGESNHALVWQPDGGGPQTIHQDDVVGIARDGDDAIVAVGLAHEALDYGYVLRIGRAPDGSWSLTEIARLPGAPDRLVAINDKLFAVSSAGRVVVFSRQGILGLARCAD